MKTIVLGLGNALLADDAIGLIVVKRLSEIVSDASVDFKTSEKVGLNLIELLQGYDQAILIDAIFTGLHLPGELVEFSLDQLPENPRLRCPHDADFKTAVELARKTGLRMPEKIIILGIEVKDNLTFSSQLSPELSASLPAIIEKISEKLLSLQNET